MPNLYSKGIKYSIYSLVFLLPLFFLPFSFEKFEFPKQYLLFFLTLISFLAWIAKQVFEEREIRFRRTPLDLPILFFLLIAILSGIFSVDRYTSLFGFYGKFSDGLITLLSLVMMYFLITNNFGRATSFQLVKVFLGSVFFVILISYLLIFNFQFSIFNKFSISNFQFFSPVAQSLEGLAMFLAVVVALLSVRGNTPHRLLVFGALGLLIIIDFAGAWWVLVLSLSLFLVFALEKRLYQKETRKLLLPVFLIVVAGLLLILNFNLNFQLPREQILGQGISWQIAFKTLFDNFKNFFFGSGIGTFFYDFVKEKPVEFNKNLFWQVRYDRGGNYIAEILSTMGILGGLSYFLLVGVFIFLSYFFLSRVGNVASRKIKRESLNTKYEIPNTKYQFSLLMGFVALIVGQFVYYQNTVLSFLFWFFLALSAICWKKTIKDKVFSFKNFPEMELLFKAGLMILFLLILGAGYYGLRIYQADITYAKAEMSDIPEERTRLVEKAVKINPNFVHYQIILARAYLTEALKELKKPQNLRDTQFLQERVAKAIDVAKGATEISPNNVVCWETLGAIYRDIRTLAAGALGWAQKAFKKAISLEPSSPVLHTELGKLYLASDEIDKAKAELETALKLKPDYIPAGIQMALVLEKEKKIEEAIEELENLSNLYPANSEILFQLGRLYYNNDQINEAILVLERVVRLVPNHSNSLYSLGVAYKKAGQIQKAISAFERVLELNPGNQDVQKKLEELKK